MTFRQPAESIRRRYDAGKKLRAQLPRDRQAEWTEPSDRADPLTTIATVNQGRVTSLQSEKYRRMRKSPFACFRGAAVLMASDLSTLPSTGLTAQLCGDAHMFNLGAYAAADGQLVFDINDFDETTPGLCGEVLAKGHARTTDAATLAGYVGGSTKLDRAIAAFAVAYAEQSTQDYRRFVTSLRKAGRSLDPA